MPEELPVLDNLRVASPCTASWEDMRGDDRSRFCRHCSKHVYDLSAMTRGEAQALVREKESGLCVRFYRRRDGTVLTRDCPVGRQRLRRALLTQVGGIAALFLAIPAVAGAVRRTDVRDWTLWDRDPFYSVALRLGIREEPVMMGAMIAPPTPLRPGK
jgi:hypothetical protein